MGQGTNGESFEDFKARYENAMQMADALREATQPDCPRYTNDQSPTTTHDSDTNSTTTTNGDHHGMTGGTRYGGQTFRF